MEEQTLNLILAISSILTAIGTLSAVILSLYLARRNRNIDLNLSVNISIQILMSNPPIPDDDEYLSFSITNVDLEMRTLQVLDGKWEYLKKFTFSKPLISRIPT